MQQANPPNAKPIDREPAVFDVIKSLTTLEEQAIVRPNNPPPGIAGFLFDIVGDEEIELRSEITDHWVEDNTTIHDQIALPPETITVRGMVAELAMSAPTQEQQSASPDPLPTIPGMRPAFTSAQELQQAATTEITQQEADAITSAQSLFSYYTNQSPNPSQTRQAKGFVYFYQLWKGRQFFTVETPWGFFSNMAIESVRVAQTEETRDQSEFTVKFKKIRFAQEITVNVGELAGRALPQRAPKTENGVIGQRQLTEQEMDQVEAQWNLFVAGDLNRSAL